jgi:Domain of unknown function (DUF6484)
MKRDQDNSPGASAWRKINDSEEGLATMVTKLTPVKKIELQESVGTVVGRVVGWDRKLGLLVDFPANPDGAVAARTTLRLELGEWVEAINRKREALLVFDRDDRREPILVGFLEDLPGHDRQPQRAGKLELEARVDGRRVVLRGEEEIVLRCGAASITLCKDGRLIVRGTEVISHARGRNRITGGVIHIN